MFSRVWKPNETPALVFEIVFEKNLSRRNKQLKARRLQQNETTPTKMSRDLSTSSLLKAWIERKIRTSRVCHRMNSQLNSN